MENERTADLAEYTKAELKSLCEALTNENECMKTEYEEMKAAFDKTNAIAQKAADISTRYQSLAGDFENYKKRNADLAAKSREDAACELAKKLLPVLDNFTRALAQIKDETVLAGMKMIEDQLKNVLAGMEVTRYDSLGETFDMNLHDAIMTQPADEEDKIVAVLADGYKFRDRVLRAAQVVVGKRQG